MSLKSSCISTINKQLKANFKFIKYDGMILDTFSEKLFKKNEMDIQKTIEYLDTLSKKDINDSFECIVKELETVNEINDVYKNTIQKNKDEIELLQEKYDKLIEINSGLETSINEENTNFEELKKYNETEMINFAIFKYEENENLKTMTDEAISKFKDEVVAYVVGTNAVVCNVASENTIPPLTFNEPVIVVFRYVPVNVVAAAVIVFVVPILTPVPFIVVVAAANEEL